MINTPARKRILLAFPSLITTSTLALLASISVAAPAKSPKAQANLSFDVTARIGSTGADGKTAGPQQTFSAKVLISGAKARLETGAGDNKSVLLFTPPYVYRLLPTPKAGIRWQMDQKKGADFRDFDPQTLLSNPENIRTSLLKSGAKNLGASKLGGQAVDIYEIKKPGERLNYAKAWIGSSNALPYRLEAKGQGINVIASWKNYSRPKTLSATLFAPPANFRIRNLQSPPPLSGM